MSSIKKRIIRVVLKAMIRRMLRPREACVGAPGPWQRRAGDRAMQRFVTHIAMPVWLGAALLDYVWHRQTRIETTAGAAESLMHLLMMGEGAPVIFGALFLEINAGALALLIGAALLHEATAIRDVAFTAPRRKISPREQHTHSFLEMVPFCVASVAVCLHWEQFLGLVGAGRERPDFVLRLRRPLLPLPEVLTILGVFLLAGGLPHLEELTRCVRAERLGLTGIDSPPTVDELFGN